MGDPEKFGSSISDTVIIVKTEPILIPADDDEEDFEGFVTEQENDVDPLGDIGGVISPSLASTAEAGNSSTFVAHSSEGGDQHQHQFNEPQKSSHFQDSQLVPFPTNLLGKCGDIYDENQAGKVAPGISHFVIPTISSEQLPPPKRLKKIRPCICRKCNVGFPSSSLLEHHLSTVHIDDRPYACRHCSKRFASLPTMKKHETIHDPHRFNGTPQFACDLCDKRYHLNDSLDVHRRKSHFGYKPPTKRTEKDPVIQHHSRKGTRNPNPFKKPKEIFPCPHCDLTFKTKSLLKKHMTCHTKEKPFQCSICQQRYPRKWTLLKHIRTVHENPTPSGVAHAPPKWQHGQPQACNLCGKIFRMQTLLRRHMTLHTGEKPYECDECGMRFRLGDGLRKHKLLHAPRDTTGMSTFKCRVCGKEGIRRFVDFQRHRMTAHWHIPWKDEGEKAFACGICGKPYYQRYRAVTCATLGHDPSSLEKAMFKHKCPECPPEALGYHHLAYLRRHWEEEHQGKILPGELRVGMYSDNLKPDELPRVIIGKGEAAKIRESGPPPVKTEFPLCIELELLPMPEEERIQKRKPGAELGRRKSTASCDICAMRFANRGNLRRHLRVVHDPGREQKIEVGVSLAKLKCSMCGKRFGKLKTLKEHEKGHQNGKWVPGRGRGRPRKNDVVKMESSGAAAAVELGKETEDNNVMGEPDLPRKLQPNIKTETTETIGIPAVPSEDISIDEITIKEEPITFTNDMEADCGGVPLISSVFSCRFCERKFGKERALRIHELRAHVKPRSTARSPDEMELTPTGSVSSSEDAESFGARNTVNLNDEEAVRRLIGSRAIQIKLVRLEEDDDALEKAFSNGIKIRLVDD